MTTASHTTGALVSASTRQGFLGLGLLGAVVFLYGIFLGDGIRAWQSLLVNFLFFAGLAQAGVVLSAIMHATSSHWGRSLKRIAEATSAFLPVAFVLLLVLLAGIGVWAPWVHAPVEAKEPWLNIPFFVTRELLAFVLLSGLSVSYVYRSLRPDIGMLHESGERPATGIAERLIAGWQGLDVERDVSQRSQDRLAVAVLIAYAWVFTLIAFDFVVSLDPHWFSTLMGGYYFVGNLFVGLAFLAVIATWGRDRLGIAHYVGRHQLHDVGKLLFGFCILWAYMFWSQYLVIWYGDLPEETEFIHHRMHGAWGAAGVGGLRDGVRRAVRGAAEPGDQDASARLAGNRAGRAGRHVARAVHSGITVAVGRRGGPARDHRDTDHRGCPGTVRLLLHRVPAGLSGTPGVGSATGARHNPIAARPTPRVSGYTPRRGEERLLLARSGGGQAIPQSEVDVGVGRRQ